jgi:hypothetical protein
MSDYREWTLSRGVQPPVSFVGELLLHSDGVAGISLWQSLASKGRWHALSVFRTREGRLLVYIAFRTRVTGELDNREVFTCEQPAELPALFAQYQQVAFPVIAQRMVGDPAKRQREAVELLARFQRQVAELLRSLPSTASRIG